MNKILILLAVSLFALLYSCGDEVQKSQPDDATLYVTVQDGRDGSLLAGAKATLGTTQGTTDAKGLATLKFKSGSRVLLVEKENYASYRTTVLPAAANDVASNGVSIVGDIRQSVQLYPATAGLKGVLFYRDSRNIPVPMPGVPIRVDITGSSLATTSYGCGKTNDNGEYECKDLPAIGSSGFSVIALGTEISGVNYPATTIPATSSSLLPGVVANNGRTDYSAANIAFVLIDSQNRIIENANKSQPLTLVFSEAIDATQFRQNWVTVSSNQAVNIEWEGTQLKLAPALPGWIDGTQITLRTGADGIKSISGKTLSGTVSLSLKVLDKDISEGKVEGVKDSSVTPAKKDSIEYTSLQARITWNKFIGAASYKVFVRTSDTTNFKEVAVTSTANDTTATVNINDGKPIGGKTNWVRVQAYNGNRKSLFSDPVEIKAKDDEKAPTYAISGTSILDRGPVWLNDYCVSVPDENGIIKFCLNGTEQLTSDEFLEKYDLKTKLGDKAAYDREIAPNEIIAFGRVFFNKPMNTSSVPRVTCAPDTDAGCKKLKLTPKWNNDQNLNLTVTTVAGNVVTAYSDITFSINGLKGANSKDFAANGAAAVKIRFVSESYCNSPAGLADYNGCTVQACGKDIKNSKCGDYYCNTNKDETLCSKYCTESNITTSYCQASSSSTESSSSSTEESSSSSDEE